MEDKKKREGGKQRMRVGLKLESGRRLPLWQPEVKLSRRLHFSSSVCFSWILYILFNKLISNVCRKMYERHKRRYSFCAKGERALDVVLIKVGYFCAVSNKVVWCDNTAITTVITVI